MKKCVYCVLLVLAGCGGDGGSDGALVMDDDDVVILPTYGYQISALPGVGPLTVSIPDEGGLRIISLNFGNTLNGEINVSVDLNNNATPIDYSLQTPSTMTVDTDVGAPFLGAFDIEVTEDLQFLVGDPPTSGMIEVVTATETVVLQPFDGGLLLRFNGAAPVTLTWDELENFLDDDLAIDWQRRAALAAEVLEFVFLQFFSVTETLNFIDDQLVTLSPLEVPCDAFTGSPPEGVLAQGQSTFTWLGSGSIPIGGDDFLWSFTHCWLDDVGDAADQLINGSIDLNNYIEVIDAQFRLIGTGFDEVIFNNLTIASTEENPMGVFNIVPNDTITISGGFDLALIGFTS